MRSRSKIRATPRHSLHDFILAETESNKNNTATTSTGAKPGTQMSVEQVGMTCSGEDPRKRVTWKQNPLVSTLFWLVGNSQIIGCPHQDSIENRREIFDTFQQASGDFSQNSVLLERKNADTSGKKSHNDSYQGSVKSRSFANLEAANQAYTRGQNNHSSDEISDGPRSRDSTTSGNYSPNYGYGFYINMTPPIESFSRGGNKRGSAH